MNGTRHWIALSTVGQDEEGAYQVGGHTQGDDGGTFWYSNDPTGMDFDGQSLTPEMAIYAAGITAVPEPSSMAIAGLGILGMLVTALRRPRST